MLCTYLLQMLVDLKLKQPTDLPTLAGFKAQQILSTQHQIAISKSTYEQSYINEYRCSHVLLQCLLIAPGFSARADTTVHTSIAEWGRTTTFYSPCRTADFLRPAALDIPRTEATTTLDVSSSISRFSSTTSCATRITTSKHLR